VPSNLASLCKDDGLVLCGNKLAARFKSGRGHVVSIDEKPDHYLLSAVVARRAVLEKLERPEIWAWRRNRSSALVGFRVDDRGRLLAESWVPKAGLSKDEFQTYVWTLAAEADRVEHLLSGRDLE
jgi:hypothetical protein